MMKTKIFLLGFLFSFTFCFGQTNWGNWIPDKCFNYIQYQMKVDNVVQNSNQCGERQTNYSVKIRNTSSKSVYIEHAIYTTNNRQIWICEQGQIKLISRQDAAYFNELKPNETITVKYGYIRGGDQLFFEVWSLKTISNDGKWSECYQKCDNGQSCYKCQLKPNLGNCCNSTTVSEHDRIYGTNSNNQSQNQQNQTVTNSSSNTIQNNQIIIEPDKSYEMTKQVFDIASNYVSSLQAQAERERQADIAMENKELAKLDIESDFNEINSPEDYEKVSLTSINYKNLIKILNIEVKKICATALSDPNKAKDKIKISTKIESAFLGGNTVNVRVFDIGRKFDVGKCAIEIFGIVQTNKILNFEEIQKVLIAGKYQILNVYKFKKNDDEFSKEKFTKDIEIIDINKNGNFIEITANTKNTKNDKFRLINFNKNQFVLFYQEKDKLFNYIIKLN